jgi:bifunctional ADP-heptose synthase (sugar kinase/adenylyltransferase)
MTFASTGKWDVMHHGHFLLLHHIAEIATETNGVMLILVDSDDRIERMTGLPPVFRHSERALQVRALLNGIAPAGMFSIYVFDSDLELEDIYKLHAESEKILLIKGSEWKDKPIIGKDFVDVFYFDSGERKMSSTIVKERVKKWYEDQK